MPEPIDTTTMPGDNMDPDAIDAAAGKIRAAGSKVSSQGGTVLTGWQQISASYDAPEENTLFHAMNPVKAAAEKFGTDVGAAATALETFAEEVRTIKQAVAAIRADAASFLAGIGDGVEKTRVVGRGAVVKETVDWDEDQASVDANNALRKRTADQQEALWAAERACATTIRGLVGLGPVLPASESNPNGYGVDDIPDDAEMPWGKKVERKEGCGEQVVHGVANGAGALIGGAANLVGFKYTGSGLWDHWDWSWDWSPGNAGQAWAGVGKFAVGAATMGPLTTPLVMAMPGPVGAYLRDAQKTAAAGVAGLVAIDLYASDPLHKWKEDGWMAFGEAGFNVATIVVAPAKVGNLGRVGRLAEGAMNLTDPLYLASKALSGMKSMLGPTVENLARLGRVADFDTALKITSDIDIPTVPREGVGPDHPNVGGHQVDAPPARDYTEPQARHDTGAPDHAPAPTHDREPVVVGGRGDTDPATHHSGGDSSTGGSAGRDGGAPTAHHGGTPAGRDGGAPSSHNGDGGTPTGRDGGDGAPSGRDAGDPAAPSGRDGTDGSPVGRSGEDAAPTTDRDGDVTTDRQGETPPATAGDGGRDDVSTTPRDSSDTTGARDDLADPPPDQQHGSNGSDGSAGPHGGTIHEPTLPAGLERQSWETRAGNETISTSHLQRVDPDHQSPTFSTKSANELGEIGEKLTAAEFKRQGWEIVFHGRHVQMPGESPRYFVPDFIVRNDLTGEVVAVESKMGPGAHFTQGQLDGYAKLANGDPVVMRSAKMQRTLSELGIDRVDAVQVYRWGTEFIPDQRLIAAAGLANKVVP